MPLPDQILAFGRKLTEKPLQAIGLLLAIIVVVVVGAFITSLSSQMGKTFSDKIVKNKPTVATKESSPVPDSTSDKSEQAGLSDSTRKKLQQEIDKFLGEEESQ